MALGGFGSGIVGGATVKLFLDDSQFNRGLAEARGQTQAASGAMGRFGGAARAGFAIAAAAAVKFAADSLTAFMEAEEVMAQFQNTLDHMPGLVGETTQAFEDQATALQNLTGFQDEAIIGADTILARFDLTAEQIRSAIPTVLDFARATGRDVPDAAEAVGKALLGNTRALKDVGIEYTRTGDRGVDFDNILTLLSGHVDGAAEAFGETLPGKIDIAKAKLDDFKEDVGAFIGSELLLLTGDLEGAASMWVDLAGATDEAKAHFGSLLSTVGATGDKIGHLTAEQSAARTEMQHLTRETAIAEVAMGNAETGAAAEARAMELLADAHGNAALAARNLYAAELSLAGGLLGLQGASLSAEQAQRDLKDANAEVNKLAADGQKGSREYRDALMNQDQAALSATQSQLSLVGAVQQYVEDSGNSAASTREATALIRDYADAAGLTGAQTRDLISDVLGLKNQYGSLPASVTTQISAPGAADASATIAAIKERIDALHDKTVNIYVYTHYKQDI